MLLIPRCVLRPVAAAIFCCAWIGSVCAIERNSSYQAALESIKADDLHEYVGTLADPAMEGREAGTRGGHAAGDYLIERYARLHLAGAGDEDGFVQSFAPNFRNVLARLQGSDPHWRDQVILVGAHYDHVGYGTQGLSRGPSGYIHPGADDNASGTATVLELAHAFTLLSSPPKCSILFVAWDGEEKGLLGSRHWLAHPTVPLDHLLAAVNLDMVGRLRDKQLIVFGARSGYGWRRLLSRENEDSKLRLSFSWVLKPNADHYPFFEQGIPVVMFHTGLHDQYHRPTDTAKLINSAGMAQVTRMLFGLLYEMADRPAVVPAFRVTGGQETPDTEQDILSQSGKPADRFGVGWIDDAAVAGGIRVSTLAPGSPAEQAGVRVGDCIVQFAGRKIASDDDFFAAVAAAENSASLKVKRSGEDKPRQLTVQLPGVPLQWGIVWRVDDAEPGAIILSYVVPGSPAARAGLAAGDRIYQVAGRDFADEAGFAQLAKNHPERLQLLVERDGRLRTAVLELRQVEPARRAA